MKKKLQGLSALMLLFSMFTQAQMVSDFEDLLLPMPPLGAYWDGSDLSGGFVSGGMYFPNQYSGYWANGFAYSSVIDSVTSGFTNLYAAKPASGFNGSNNYAVVQPYPQAVARLNNVMPTMVIHGFYVTNGTYAYNSMRDGDAFARKFGDTTGTSSGLPQGSYPDYFKLTVKSYVAGQLSNDSVEFYLADFRFTNDSLDYIVNTWEWVDCSVFQVFDSLKFTLSSSDNGAFGMNTPAFFCIDNITIDPTVGINGMNRNNDDVYVFPNPATDFIYFNKFDTNGKSKISIININGQVVIENSNYNVEQGIDISQLAKGFYSLTYATETRIMYQKFVKQ